MTSIRSSGPSPASPWMLSSTSRALPHARPSGRSMAVSSATTRQPRASPSAIIVRASSMARSSSGRNAPDPVFTSSTRPSSPSASFLDMMLAEMSGMDSTVAVTSRRAYSRLSAGAISWVWPSMAQPRRRTCASASRRPRPVRNPAMASSLSRVPPVWPSPRPDIMGTATPQLATSGARSSETLSPTPPVECLSTTGRSMPSKRSRSPEAIMASVRAASSAGSRPRK